jgi:hypothetical protein
MIGQNWPADRPIRALGNLRLCADTGLEASRRAAHGRHKFKSKTSRRIILVRAA